MFWQAFEGKLGPIMKPEKKALRFFQSVVDPSFAISAFSPQDRLLGIAGFKTGQGVFVGGTLGDLAKVYGRTGAIWRGVLLSLLERSVDGKFLLMDGIFVTREARGMGIGSALLDAIILRARTLGLSGVRLDVIDTNPRAQRLYLRKGFKITQVSSAGPLKHVFGFSSAATMVCKV